MIERISSGGPWEAVIGYSRAVRAGDWVVVSGTTATVDGAVQHPGDAAAQARIAFEIALRAVAAAGGTVSQVVRTRMYLADAIDGDAVGAVHAEFFGDIRPAATMVAVAGFLDPAMRVEVEVEAFLG